MFEGVVPSLIISALFLAWKKNRKKEKKDINLALDKMLLFFFSPKVLIFFSFL